MAMAMATPSFSCSSATSHSGRLLGREQQNMPCEERAVSTNCRAWESTRVASFLINCRARESIGVARFGTGKFEFTVRLNARRGGSGADPIQLLPSQSRGRRIAAISRVDDEFRDQSEVDGGGDGAETSSLEDENTGKEVQIDLQLPRRRLLVEFTCNVCQTRNQRLVNPEAYKRGTVYVQCGGCGAYHELVDNLGLVVEYDFRKETDSNSP